VGIDYLTICLDKFGMIGLYLLRDHFSKLVFLFPVPAHDSEYAALAIFSCSVIYGAFSILMSDPGSEILSEAVSQVNKWFGIHHRVSLVDRHESNGVEGGNKQVLRHLSKLFMEERIKDEWSSPQHVGWAMFLMNSFDKSESGTSAYDLTFGTISDRRFDFPVTALDSEQAHRYVRMLDNSGENPAPQNFFQPGDLVLFRLSRDRPKPHKLHPIYLGPFEVASQTKNDVSLIHMATGKTSIAFVGDLKAFFGDRVAASALASVDADQYLVDRLSAYRGDPLQRSSMYFYVHYSDGDLLWMLWSLDLQNSSPYLDFCYSLPALLPLTFTSAMATEWLATWRRTAITDVRPHQETLLDVRCFGEEWYNTLPLPDLDFISYRVPCAYGGLTPNKRKISLVCSLLSRKLLVDNAFISMYSTPPPGDYTLLTDDHLLSYPMLRIVVLPTLPTVEDFKYLVGQSFYEPDARGSFIVTRISQTRTRDIVAHVSPVDATGKLRSNISHSYHVAEVVKLVPHPPSRPVSPEV
jgi:hypothetical protein